MGFTEFLSRRGFEDYSKLMSRMENSDVSDHDIYRTQMMRKIYCIMEGCTSNKEHPSQRANVEVIAVDKQDDRVYVKFHCRDCECIWASEFLSIQKKGK
jgi:hypothetical protein